MIVLKTCPVSRRVHFPLIKKWKCTINSGFIPDYNISLNFFINLLKLLIFKVRWLLFTLLSFFFFVLVSTAIPEGWVWALATYTTGDDALWDRCNSRWGQSFISFYISAHNQSMASDCLTVKQEMWHCWKKKCIGAYHTYFQLFFCYFINFSTGYSI